MRELDVDRDGALDTCIDGDGSRIEVLGNEPAESCISSPRMADGFSAVVSFIAVPAMITGQATTPQRWRSFDHERAMRSRYDAVRIVLAQRRIQSAGRW